MKAIFIYLSNFLYKSNIIPKILKKTKPGTVTHLGHYSELKHVPITKSPTRLIYTGNLLVILISMQVLAENHITKKSLIFDSSNDHIERLDALEKENQHLLGRIEIIEHNLARLKKILSSTKQEIIKLQEINATKNLADDSMVGDVFERLSNKKIEKIHTVNSIPGVTKDKVAYDIALISLKENKLIDAEKKFANFLKNYPNSALSSNAYFWYGESFFRRNIFNKAAINYLKGYKQSPKGAKAYDSLLKLALSLGELKKIQEACSILDKLEIEFPNRSATSVKRAKDTRIKFACKY